MSPADQQPALSPEELHVAYDELVVHFARAAGHLEHATRHLADLGTQNARLLRALAEIREAAGATGTGTSHHELCLMIRHYRAEAAKERN